MLAVAGQRTLSAEPIDSIVCFSPTQRQQALLGRQNQPTIPLSDAASNINSEPEVAADGLQLTQVTNYRAPRT
ncbi:hypothetical protein PC129_g15185 [Phytophthora cactorum]|uniref:Uncharacterized protein n=1 Tax=Phytophthora cactorum TaxID=29920 RepID=A0A8T1BWC7_9STRA|nr:hypothetical protein PC112_g14096 [Phytophthora cactorum]KAG2861894.1 hypothetical protein PC113_g6775 [Phytophthora cactorum]KAG2899775.1 hypothetical protein PC114_g13793 [Phytophthora cactorum]KAG2907800.1 hypothetical protein PC115_g13778 [Phytophthora cactorum]KAG2924929.1 hypothetical protein PC117_g15288 [Phytophthora cactorum]